MYLMKRSKNDIPVLNEEGGKDYHWEDVAYWRKANEIHRWFLDYCNLDGDFNCEYAEIGKDGLEELVETCKLVLGRKGKVDAKRVAEQNLPTQSGFFFGSVDYDDWYYEDLESTIEQVEKILETTDWDNEIVVYSCWW